MSFILNQITETILCGDVGIGWHYIQSWIWESRGDQRFLWVECKQAEAAAHSESRSWMCHLLHIVWAFLLLFQTWHPSVPCSIWCSPRRRNQILGFNWRFHGNTALNGKRWGAWSTLSWVAVQIRMTLPSCSQERGWGPFMESTSSNTSNQQTHRVSVMQSLATKHSHKKYFPSEKKNKN